MAQKRLYYQHVFTMVHLSIVFIFIVCSICSLYPRR
uniref:Uncharacterized protein n=1 Tax=Anguilla anguilla TaxID=7936 RepID=A0A0E9VHA9_ANGAN